MISEKHIAVILKTLTLEEKAALCSGADAWLTKENHAKRIPSLRMADGPHGIRREDKRNHKKNGGHSVRATCFPPQVALASSWSPLLTKRVGQAIAEECLHYEIGLLLGPGVNIKRSPLNGRNFEYYSEDPLLAGELAAGFIQGVQQLGVGTSLKHYAVNNQETNRMSISAVVDERALYDLYLKPFEIAVRKAKPATVMASYNRVNGVYATENRQLLTAILRKKYGFTGSVISDWGAVSNRVAGLAAGMDLEMPASGGVNDYAIVQAVLNGQLAEDILDDACRNLLATIFAFTRTGKPRPQCDFKQHHILAKTALTKSAVLLKNQSMLPLSQTQKIAVLGEMAKKPRYQGGGSSLVNPKHLVSFIDALKQTDCEYVYEPGYHNVSTNEHLLRDAIAAAKQADAVVVFAGLPDQYECEGYDRQHMRLPDAQRKLIEQVSACGKPVCVVLCCGSAVEAPWLDTVDAALLLHLGGEAVGEAAVSLLFGQENPSGKLAESWPLQLEDTPCAAQFPMGPTEVTYNESIFVGYRYYDTAKKPVLFPFGFGLSYTSFQYSALTLSAKQMKPRQILHVNFLVKNTGARAGEEIVQLYLAHKKSTAFQPSHELKGFARVSLQPGEEKKVTLKLAYHDFAFYDIVRKAAVVETGEYEIQIGANSRDLPLTASVKADGLTVNLPLSASAKGSYGHIKNNDFKTKTFLTLLKRKVEGNHLPKRGSYTNNTPLGNMTDSFVARVLLASATKLGEAFINFSTDPVANKHVAQQMAKDMPFKNLVLNTSGIISPQASRVLLDVCNGKTSLLHFFFALAKPQPYRKMNRKNRKR